MRAVKKLLLLLVVLVLVACTDQQAKEIMKSWEGEPKISYYPYLTINQYRFLNQQNVIGVIPGEIIVPPHSAKVIASELNANSWWGLWIDEITISNYFIAEVTKQILGCGALKAGTNIEIKPGVYTFNSRKIVVSYPLRFKLKQDIASMCETKTELPREYFKKKSLYWGTPYSKDRIYS